MAKNKIERIDQEITKVREKIAEYQEKLKALEAQKTEAENLEIVQMVRALRMTPAPVSYTHLDVYKRQSEETFANSISIPPQGDAFDSIREEYTTMLQNQLVRGNNGLIKTKYLTFGIDADSIKAAKPRLERIETDILNNFKRLGVAARTLDGKERLSQLHAVFHMDEQLPFQFEWDWLAPSGLSTKDFIAPSSFCLLYTSRCV